MAKTAAQRQAAYRARRPHAGDAGNGERRLSVWIDTRASLALARLARCYAVTQQALIERLVIGKRSFIDALSSRASRGEDGVHLNRRWTPCQKTLAAA
jgi:hypothetical protein